MGNADLSTSGKIARSLELRFNLQTSIVKGTRLSKGSRELESLRLFICPVCCAPAFVGPSAPVERPADLSRSGTR